MLRKKLILLGAPQVGKTSLVARWVKGIFSDRYLSTIGVKVEKKQIEIGKESLSLQIWDLMGDIDISGPALTYIRGASAMLLVADGTRLETVYQALNLASLVISKVGHIPCALALNKLDQEQSWEVGGALISQLEKQGWSVLKTSALTGAGVEAVFMHLAFQLLNNERMQIVS